MNKRELEKLRVMYDEDNECWAITIKKYIVADLDIACELDIPYQKYFDLLINSGGYYLDEDEDCVGFETKKIAEKCLEAIKNYKDNDIIGKVEQSKSIIGETIVRLDYDMFAESYVITLSNGRKIKGEI